MTKRVRHLSNLQGYKGGRLSMDDYIKEEYLCQDGKAQIDICLYEGLELFNPLSMGKQKELKGDIYAFIDKKLYNIPSIYPVRLCFYGSKLEEGTQEAIRLAIQEHYSLSLQDKDLHLRINLLKIIALSLVGFFTLGLYFTLELSSLKPLFKEFLSIAGTFSLWEAVDFWLLERKSLRLQYLNASQAAFCEVIFATGHQESTTEAQE